MTHPFIPNEADATFPDQAEPDSVDFAILLLAHEGTGVASSCFVTESTSPAMSVDVTAGVVLLRGSQIQVAAQASKTIATADGSNPRVDLITVDESGTVVVTSGTAAVDPEAPAIPDNSIPLAFVFVPASDTTIEDNQINDKRVVLGDAPSVSQVFDLLHSEKPSPDTLDDEFASFALDSKWTVVSGSSGTVDPLSRTDQSTYDLVTRPGWLLIQCGSDGTEDVQLRQDVTLADGESVVLAIAPNFNMGTNRDPDSNHIQIGLGLNTSTTDIEPADTFALVWLAEADPAGMDIQGAAENTGGTSVASSQVYLPFAPGVMFARIFRDGTDYHLFYSIDGVSWSSLMGSLSGAVTTTLDRLWISVKNTASTADEPVPITAVKWIRQGGSGVDPWDPHIHQGGHPHTIMDEGVNITQRPDLDFVGSGVMVADTAVTLDDYLSSVLAHDPYLHWNMDDASGDVQDSTANNRDGTANGNPVYSVVPAPTSAAGTAITLDGTGDFFSRVWDSAFQTDFTAIVWVKGTGVDEALFTTNVDASNKRWIMTVDGSGFAAFGSGNSMIGASSTKSIDDDVWHMVALAVPASGTARLYVDGVEEATATWNNDGTGSPALKVGQTRAGQSADYTGDVGMATIIESQLSGAQVSDLYDTRAILGDVYRTQVQVGVGLDFRPSDETVHVDDQEFTGAIGGTEVVTTGTVTWVQNRSKLGLRFASISANDIAARVYPLTTTTAPLTIEAVIRPTIHTANHHQGGILFSDGTTATDSVVIAGVHRAGTIAHNRGTFTNIENTELASETPAPAWAPNPVYMRLVYVSANNWQMSISADGIIWTDFDMGDQSFTMAPTHFGVYATTWGDGTTSAISWEYLRVTESDLSL